jgi:iron complex transport system ATP-binding protein
VNPPLLELKKVTVVRGEKVVLDDISLSVDPGENVAIIGPNGSGKSTLIKTITQECYPSAAFPGASVRVLGKERWHLFELRAMMGIVSNDLLQTCTREITGRDIILSGFFSSIGIWTNHHVTPEMEAKADEILALLEVEHLAEREMTELSSGEARRLVIGRALIHDPLTLVLDEHTNSLDLHSAKSLNAILRKISQSGKGILMVTHHLPDIIPEITRVILIRDGKVYRDGSKDAMLTSENLSELFATPLEVVRRDGYFHLW